MTAVRPAEQRTEPGVGRRRGWAVALAVGAGFMLGRAGQMIFEGSLSLFVPWVGALLVLELCVDAVTLVATVRWAIRPTGRRATVALRAVAATVAVHAVRVGVFVVGRTGPWTDFDVRPELRAEHAGQWTWLGVWSAGILAACSVVALVSGWAIVRRRRRAVNT